MIEEGIYDDELLVLGNRRCITENLVEHCRCSSNVTVGAPAPPPAGSEG